MPNLLHSSFNPDTWMSAIRDGGLHAGRKARQVLGRWARQTPAGLSGNPIADVLSQHRQVEESRTVLLEFGKETDAEFTELAQGLSGLNARFNSIREQTETLDTILHQRDKDNVLAKAYQVYKSSVDLVHASMGIALSEQQQMAGVEAALTHACSVQQTFKRNNLLLRILTMSIRMEASRIDTENRAVFLNVAAAIAEIDNKIAQTTEEAFSRIEQVIAEAREERLALHGLEQNLQSRAQHSIETLQKELAGYKQTLLPCADLSCKIGELIAQSGPLTLQIITSLQYQDIVRQQLEHVSSGFGDIASHLRELKEIKEAAKKPELGFIHHAACVQKAHLDASRAEIEKAGADVAAGLKQMLELGEMLITNFNELDKTAQEIFGHSNISTLFKQEIQQLTLIADQSEKANLKISTLVNRIDEVVSVFSKEITSHEFEVKLVSLNAQIAAARLNSAEALNKLAEESSLAATSNAAATAELTAELQTCLSQLQAIKSDADQFMEIVTQEKTEMEKNAHAVSQQLASLGVQVGRSSSEVRQQFSSLHETQNELLSRLRFTEIVASTYEPAIAVCDNLRRATHDYALPGDLTETGLRKLSEHKSRYTMESETELHASTMDGSASKQHLAPAAGDIDLFTTEPDDTKPSPETGPCSPQAASTTPVEASSHAPTAASPEIKPENPEPSPSSTDKKKEDLGDGIELF